LLKNGELQDKSEEESSQKYEPVQPLAYDHGVSLIPLAISPSSKDFTIGHHDLQVILNKNILFIFPLIFMFQRFCECSNVFH